MAKVTDPVPGYPNLSMADVEGKLNTEFESLKSGYDTFKAERLQMYREYKFQAYGNEVRGQSTIVDSSIWDAIEWMVPTLIQPYVETSEFAKIAPQNADVRSIIVAQVFQELLSYQVKKRSSWYQILYDMLKGMLIQRESFVKVTWQKKNKGMNEMVSRPILKAIPASQIRYDWTAQSFVQSRVVTQEEDMSRSDILKLMDGAVGLHKERFKKILATPGRNFKTARLRDEQTAQPNWVGEDDTKMDESHSLYLRREHWTNFDVDGSGMAVPILAVFLDDQLVQFDLNPYPFNRPPFLNAECVRDVLGNPAQSWSEVLSDIQKYKTGILRMTSDNLNAQLNGMLEYDQNNVDDIGVQLLQFAPNGMRVPIPVNRPGSINPLPPTPIAQHAYQTWELLEVAKENRSGFTRYAQGLDSKSLNQTATGITAITQRSEMRMWELAKRFSEMFIKPLAEMLISMNQELLEAQDLELQFGIPEYRFVDDNGVEQTIPARPAGNWITLAKKDIGGHFTVEVDVDIGADKQQKIDNGLTWAQFYGPFVGNGVPPEAMSMMSLNTARLMGLDQIEILMKKEVRSIGGGGVNVPRALFPDAGGDAIEATGVDAENAQLLSGLEAEPTIQGINP